MGRNTIGILPRLAAIAFVSSVVWIVACPVRSYADPTAGASASIGVFVNQPPPPASTTTTDAPTTSTTVATTTTLAPTTTTTVATTTTVTEPTPTTDTLPDVLPLPQSNASPQTGIVAQLKSVAKTTKALVSGILSGKPVADVAQAVLPGNVATVIVPAVRTASTFVFPIGLGLAVVAFLAVQQRIDSSDPKLAAAPFAHDDDLVEFS